MESCASDCTCTAAVFTGVLRAPTVLVNAGMTSSSSTGVIASKNCLMYIICSTSMTCLRVLVSSFKRRLLHVGQQLETPMKTGALGDCLNTRRQLSIGQMMSQTIDIEQQHRHACTCHPVLVAITDVAHSVMSCRASASKCASRCFWNAFHVQCCTVHTHVVGSHGLANSCLARATGRHCLQPICHLLMVMCEDM